MLEPRVDWRRLGVLREDPGRNIPAAVWIVVVVSAGHWRPVDQRRDRRSFTAQLDMVGVSCRVEGREPGRRVEANRVKVIVIGFAMGVVAWMVMTRWPRDWMRLLVAEAIVGTVLGALLALLPSG
jgi:hypothetical protein